MHGHARIQNIFNNDNNLPLNARVQVSGKPHLTRRMHFVSITRYRDEIKRTSPRYLSGKVGKKKYRPLQNAHQMQRLVPKIPADFVRQLLNALFDALPRDKHPHTFVHILNLTRRSIGLQLFCSHGTDSNRIETLTHASLSEQAAPRLILFHFVLNRPRTQLGDVSKDCRICCRKNRREREPCKNPSLNRGCEALIWKSLLCLARCFTL